MLTYRRGGFQEYSEGDLSGQNEWRVEAPISSGRYETALDRVVVQKNENGESGQALVWKAGFDEKELARIVKEFPNT